MTSQETQEYIDDINFSDIQAVIDLPVPQYISKDTESVFDRFPNLFPVQQDRLPYSWMTLNPGQTPAVLIARQPSIQYNEAGETRMEEAIRECVKEPDDYYFTATSFKFIMSIRGSR